MLTFQTPFQKHTTDETQDRGGYGRRDDRRDYRDRHDDRGYGRRDDYRGGGGDRYRDDRYGGGDRRGYGGGGYDRPPRGGPPQVDAYSGAAGADAPAAREAPPPRGFEERRRGYD